MRVLLADDTDGASCAGSYKGMEYVRVCVSNRIMYLLLLCKEECGLLSLTY